MERKKRLLGLLGWRFLKFGGRDWLHQEASCFSTAQQQLLHARNQIPQVFCELRMSMSTHGNYLQAGLWFHIFQRCVNPKIDTNN